MTCGCNNQQDQQVNNMQQSNSQLIQQNNQQNIQQNLQPKQYGKVKFTTTPSGARIYIDGFLQINPDTEESKHTPTTLLLIEGRRDFRLELQGHKPSEGYVDVFPNTTVNIHRNMTVSLGSYYPYYIGRGDISITSSPSGARIYVDGYPIVDENNNQIVTSPTTQIIIKDVYEGVHEIQLSLDGYYDKKVFRDIVPNKINEITIELQKIV